MPFVESGGLFDEETFVTAEKARVLTKKIVIIKKERVLTLNARNRQEIKVGDMKHSHPSKKKRV